MLLKDTDPEEIKDTYRMPSNYHDYDMSSNLRVCNMFSGSQNSHFFCNMEGIKNPYILIWAREL